MQSFLTRAFPFVFKFEYILYELVVSIWYIRRYFLSKKVRDIRRFPLWLYKKIVCISRTHHMSFLTYWQTSFSISYVEVNEILNLTFYFEQTVVESRPSWINNVTCPYINYHNWRCLAKQAFFLLLNTSEKENTCMLYWF